MKPKSSVHKETVNTKLPGAFSLFRPSVEALKINIGTIVGLVFSPLLATIPFIILLAAFTAAANHSSSRAGASGVLFLLIILLYLAFIAFAMVIGAAIVFATLRSADSEKTSYGESLHAGLHYFWRFMGLGISVSLLVVLGFILFIMPGFFMLKRYFLAPYYLIDRNMGIAEAMKQSAEDTKKYGGVWGILGVNVLLGALTIIPFVGWIFSFASSVLYACAPAIRYKELQKLATQAR
jgi:hypothetical protein